MASNELEKLVEIRRMILRLSYEVLADSEKTQLTNVKVSRKALEILDSLAKKYDVSRSDLVRAGIAMLLDKLSKGSIGKDDVLVEKNLLEKLEQIASKKGITLREVFNRAIKTYLSLESTNNKPYKIVRLDS